MRLLLIIFLLFSSNLFGAEMSTEKMPKHDWSFKGVTGTFDRAAIQRGYKVYREYLQYSRIKSFFFLIILSLNFMLKKIR